MATKTYTYSPSFAGLVAAYGKGAASSAAKASVIATAEEAAWRHVATVGLGGVLIKSQGATQEAHLADCREAFLCLGASAKAKAESGLARRASLAASLAVLLDCHAAAKAEGRRPSAKEAEEAAASAKSNYAALLADQAKAAEEAKAAKAKEAEEAKAKEAAKAAEEAAKAADSLAALQEAAKAADMVNVSALLAVASVEEAAILAALLAKAKEAATPVAKAAPKAKEAKAA